MKMTIRTFLVLLLPLSFAHAADTGIWDTSNNSVTYSVSLSNFEVGSLDPFQVNLSQFNAAAAATREGGSAGDYTLTSAVLSLNGAVFGSVIFENNGPTTVSPVYDFSGSSRLTYGGYSTGREYYDGNSVAMGSVAPGGQASADVSSTGTGAVSTPSITSALAGFLGDGTIATSVYFPVSGNFYSGGTDFTATIALLGSADVSVTYGYTQVPEPSTLALLGFGCVTVLMRRRFKKTAC